MDLDIKVSKILFMGNSTDTRHTNKGGSQWNIWLHSTWKGACGSAIRRSVSLIIRFGNAAMLAGRAGNVGEWFEDARLRFPAAGAAFPSPKSFVV